MNGRQLNFLSNKQQQQKLKTQVTQLISKTKMTKYMEMFTKEKCFSNKTLFS